MSLVRRVLPLTLDEAAHMLRVGRAKIYAMAREYVCSGGASAVPVVSLGVGALRVPRWSLMVLIDSGLVVRLCDATLTPHGELDQH